MFVTLLCVAVYRGLNALFDWCDSAPPWPGETRDHGSDHDQHPHQSAESLGG